VRRALQVSVTVGLLAVLTACTGSDDEGPRRLVDEPPSQPATSTPADDVPAVSGDSTLGAVLAIVPAAAETVTFTDLAAVKERLGYDGVTSESPTSERFAFWEAVRADASVFNGTRLYDDSSELALDYGWTGEDVVWEVDFSAPETGCLESMICDRATGYAVAFRDDLSMRTVLQSLQDNGFRPSETAHLWLAPDGEKEPFGDVVVIPELNALAGGSAMGVTRISDVTEGAPSALADLVPLVTGLGPVESAYLDVTGCVPLDQALGPDATEDDVTAYFKKNDPSGLAEVERYAVGTTGRGQAVAFAETSTEPTAEQLRSRALVLDGWPSLQAGVALVDVASAEVEGTAEPAPGERTSFDVADSATFRAMVLTDDAPWALCPTRPPD